MSTTMKSTALVRCGVLAILLVCAFGAAAQQAARIGYVNMKRVIDNAPQTQRGRQKLEQEFESRYNEINEMEKRLEDLQNKLLRTVEIVADDERADQELLIRTVTRDVRRSRDEYTEDFSIRFSEQQNLLIQRVDAVPDCLYIAEEQGLASEKDCPLEAAGIGHRDFLGASESRKLLGNPHDSSIVRDMSGRVIEGNHGPTVVELVDDGLQNVLQEGFTVSCAAEQESCVVKRGELTDLPSQLDGRLFLLQIGLPEFLVPRLEWKSSLRDFASRMPTGTSP